MAAEAGETSKFPLDGQRVLKGFWLCDSEVGDICLGSGWAKEASTVRSVKPLIAAQLRAVVTRHTPLNQWIPKFVQEWSVTDAVGSLFLVDVERHGHKNRLIQRATQLGMDLTYRLKCGVPSQFFCTCELSYRNGGVFRGVFEELGWINPMNLGVPNSRVTFEPLRKPNCSGRAFVRRVTGDLYDDRIDLNSGLDQLDDDGAAVDATPRKHHERAGR
ncbi:MAG: hypothetical protein IT581_06470 [Verrucomicrobiales bacterium]|nr:hypothetical protein [Verrucomicrobiales bacterium]